MTADRAKRALDILESLLNATPQEGPASTEFAVDREALADVRQQASALLYQVRGIA